MGKIEKFGKSLKKWEIWNYFEKYFLPRQNEKFKILEKCARISGKSKYLVKSEKNRKIW